jgi:hypothetical protein
MKYIKSLIKKFIPKNTPLPLGRWRTEQCNKKINSKIDLSNEDHCGPCGQYALEKIESRDKKHIYLEKNQVKHVV